MVLPDLGHEGQNKLKDTAVLVVGAGGLGCPALLYLAAAGIGRIGIADGDTVDLTNLHRQVLYTTSDLGLKKAIVATNKIAALNPHPEYQTIDEKLTIHNTMEILSDFDIVVDGSDNFPTKYLLNDACILLGKPLVYGAIHRYEGQVSVFNYQDAEGDRGPNYRDLFPEPPPPGQVPNCEEAGVMGILPGIIGCYQANEVIKIAMGAGDVLSGKLLLYDSRTSSIDKINIATTSDNPLTGLYPTQTSLINYEEFCGANDDIISIDKIELNKMKKNNPNILKAD